MYDLGIIALIALAALVMLIRGDPKWTLPPLIGAFVLFLVPAVVMYTIAFFTPKGSPIPPLFEIRQGEFFPYPYPAGSLQEALERNYKAIHETYEGLKTAQQISAGAVFAVAYTETLLYVVSTAAGGVPAAVVQLSKYAAYFSKVGDPVLQISLTTYNAVTAFVMIFHFLEFMAGAAVKMAVPLLALSLLAVIFGPTRALGGALLFFALIMIVPSYIGYYLAPVAKDFAAWSVETAKWLNATATNATGIAPVPMVVVEGTPHTLFLAGYNNTFALKSPAEISAKINQTLGIYNLTVSKDVVAAALEVAKRYKVFDKAAFNGTDWITASAGSITPIAHGNKTWLSVAVNTWLDFPAPKPEEGGCVLHGDFREFLDYIAPPEEARRLKERVDNLTRAICKFHEWLGYRSYFLRVDVPAHWRFLTVAVNYTARDRHGVVDSGVAYAHNGVWGWLAGPDSEQCFDTRGRANCAVLDTTVREGVYNFSLWSGEKRVVDPVVDWVRSEFNFTVQNSSRPVFSRSVSLYRWVETCIWCCRYVNGTCVRWCSSSRDVWQRADVAKRLGEGRFEYNTTIYARPWVPEEAQNYTGGIPVTTRTWDVQIWLEYGPWVGDGAPPFGAYCYSHSNRTYMVLSFFRAVPGPPRVLYAFTWMDNVGVWLYRPRGDPLPDTLANYTDTDGVEVVEYLEGVEHQYYCRAAFAPTAEPRWRPVVNAERNLTKLLIDNYLTLIVIRNVSLAYFARFGPYLEAAEASGSELAKATVASVKEYLALLSQAPGAVPLYYTRPDYKGRNVLIACVMYDWRSAVNITGELRLHPAREWWAASYPMGHSKVVEAVATAKADMFKYVFGTPPPPPPVNLSGFVKQWRIPWNNRTLPYTPYYSSDMKMPPPDNETGIPLWSIQNLEDIQMTQTNILSWLFTVLFITILSIVAVFEFLGALFDFPTPVRAIYGFVVSVIQDWTYWLPFRLAVRGKPLLRIWLAVKRPVMRATVRTAARVHSFFATRIPVLRRIRSPDLKEYYRRYVLWRREIAIKDPAEQVREEVKTKAKKEALERVKKAAEERADAEWIRNLRRRVEEEEKARWEKFQKIRRIFEAGDIIEVARELSPRFDAWIEKKVEMSRGSWSYDLFWWRVDRLPYMWRTLLNLDPHVVTRLVAEGKVKPEDAAVFLNLRAAIEAHVRELRWGWSRLHSFSPYMELAKEEFERARQKMIEEAEKGLADFHHFITEFQSHFEVLRRYYTEDLSRLDEKERKQLEEAAKRVVERLNEAIRHFAVIDKAPRARLISALNEALQRLAEGKAPQIPRDASVQDVVKHLALMDFNVAVRALRSAERYLEAHYAVAPTRYDTRQIAAEVVKGKIEEQLPTLKIAGAARGIVLGGRSAEEGEALLKAWKPRDPHGERWAIVGGRFRIVDVYAESPWEAVVYRFSYIHERPLEVRETVRIKSDVVLTVEYAKYLAGFKAEEKALETLRKAVEYSRIMRMLEKAEELRLTPMAVERLTADAERLRREVLQETTEIFRKFREEFFFVRDLLEGHRVIRREVEEVKEVVKVFEEALTEAFKAPQRRELVFREVFMERVERLVEEYARRGDVEAVGRIRRAAEELAKISETVGWRVVEDVTAVLPAVVKAFEEAVTAVGESRDPARFAEVFKAKAEEAAKQLEQQGMSDAAARVRKAADNIAGEVYAGGWGAVERLKPLLSTERAGEVLDRLEYLHGLFTTETLEMYRGLVYLRQVEELAKEVKDLASASKVAEEVLRRTAEVLPAAKDEAEKAKTALRAGRWVEALEGLLRVKDTADKWEQQTADTAGGVEKIVVHGREAAEYSRRISELLPRAEALNADVVKPALEAAVNRDYGRALVLIEAAERAVSEKMAAMRDVEPLAKTLERLGVEAARLGLPEYRQRAMKEVEEAVAALRGLADLPTAVQRVEPEKTAKAAEAFGLAETASLLRTVEKVRKEAGDVYPIFVKAVAEALKAPEGERAETFRRVFTAETEKMAKAFEERGLKTEAENLRRAAETALKAAESIAWKALEEITQRLSSAVEEAERLVAKLRDEAAARQVAEYGYYSALASLAREVKEVVIAKRDVEEKLAKLIEDVMPAVKLIAPHLLTLLERLKKGDYSIIPALEAELPKLAERHRQLQKLVDELKEARKSLEKVAHIDKKVKELEKALKKAPEDVKTVFDEAFKALKVRDFEKAVAELDRLQIIIEEKKARLQPLEGEIQRAKEAAERLGLEKVAKALERPTEKNASKALGELERELARIYGALELPEYIKRPRADADFGHAWAVARVLGLEEADKFFRALSDVSLYLLREGREVFHNPLYDEVKHLIDQEHVRALIRAPMYSYVVDRLGPDVLQPVYARWYGFFTDYGPYLNTAYEHAKTSAAVAKAPVGITGGFSYADKMMKWLGDFSSEAVIRGLKAYYRGEGRPFRELSEMTVRGAKIQLFDKAASILMLKAAQMLSEAKAASDEATAKRLIAEAHMLKLLASVLRARAAYEEVRLVQAYLKGAQRRAEALMWEAERERDVDRKLALETKAREMLEAAQRKAEKHLADARARYKAYFAEVRDFVGSHGDIREAAMKYFGLTAKAFAGDPEAVAERMIRAVDVRRVISWADELKLPKELGEIAVRIADAGRVYAKFEKILRAKAEPIPPVYDLEKTGRFFSDVRPHPPLPKSRVEEAVPKVVRDVLTAYYGRLKNAAEKAAVYLALIKNDERYAEKEVKRAYQALQKALKAKDKEQALKALEELKAALKALGIEAEGEDVKTVLKAVEEKLRPAYEEYLEARREFTAVADAIAKFSPEAALALIESAREGGADSIGRWMSLIAYKTGKRALEEYAWFWARPVEKRWDSLPQAVRELIARREEEAVYELVRGVLKSVGIGVKKGVEMDLQAYEEALEKVFTANGEWPELRDYVKQVIETARRVQKGETSTEELEKAIDELFRAYGAKAAERFVRSDRLEDAVEEMHEGMRHYARNSGLKIRREAAERALLLGLSVMPEDVVEWYARGGWHGRLVPYVAYWTEDEKLARRAGEAGWEVRQIQRPVSFEEGVPKEWRTAYVVAPFGFDLSAVEKAVAEYVDGAESGIAHVRPVEWSVPEAFLWFILRDRQPVREGEWITAYSIDRLSIEEPLSKFGEALRTRNFDEARKAVRELYEARLNRTLWQIVYEFDRERAEAALEHLRQRYGEPEGRLWERHDELYLTWLAFRLADEFEAYLRSGAGREFKTKEEVAGAVFMPWLPVDLAPLFWLRLVGDPEGEADFRAAWVTAVNMWFERMAEPYQPKKPAVARKAIELFNAFVGAGFKYEELFPPKPEAQKPEAVKPAERLAVEAVEERGLRREAEKQAARPETVKPETKPEAEVVRGLRRGPRAPIVDVIPEWVEAVDYLLGRFGFALDRDAAFKAKSLVTAKVQTRLEKMVVKEPEFAHVLAEVAEHVLSSFGRLMASPDAARHVHEALFYYFEGYQTRDGEVLFARIERTVREAVRKAEEAGIPDAEYRIKQFILELIDILATAGERYRRDALKAVSTVEKALRTTTLVGLSATALYSVYHGLYSEAVVSSVASAVALAEVGRFREAVEYVQRAAKALYEAAKDVFEHVKITVQRLVELFVEAVTRVLAWIDEHKAYLFLMAAVTAEAIALSTALNLWGLVELEKLAYAAAGAPPFFARLADTGGKAAERFGVVAERWRVDENEKQKIEEILNAPQKGRRPYEVLRELAELENLPPFLAKLKWALEYQDEAVQDAAVVATLVLYKTLVKSAGAYGEWAELYRWARSLVEKQEFVVTTSDIKRLREAQRRLEEVAEEAWSELYNVLALYSQSEFYKKRPDLLNKLKQLLEVKLSEAEGLANAWIKELSMYSNANMGTKVYAALLSVARGGMYGHAAMLLMGEGALADVVLLAPISAYNKAKDVAKERGETVNPSRSRRRAKAGEVAGGRGGAADLPRVGAAGWEDKAASVLLRFLLGYGKIDPQLLSGAGEADLKFRRVEKGDRKGFQVFRTYGGVEAPVGELRIGKTAYFTLNKEGLKRLVEEAKETAPDLSGLDKARQYLEWRTTDVTTSWGQIVGTTTHSWQLRWYFSLLGKEESFRGVASITKKEDINFMVTAYWPREREDQILRESKWLESLLNQHVKSWRELVDAINWRWVLERVRKLADELKPWIGPEKMSDVEREGLVRRMLDELELLTRFAEERRGMDDDGWRVKRAKRLAEVVETLSEGRIAGEYAERLAWLITYYAERHDEMTKERIENLAKEVGISEKEVWSVVKRVLSGEYPYAYCLARDCARDEVIRKFVAPALELIMLDKALRGKFDREEALLNFGEMYATAIAGDGSVGRRLVELAVGGELGGGAALLRLATLHLLNQLLPKELKFGVRTYVEGGNLYIITAYGENAARFMRLLAVSAPSAGGEYLSEKFKKFMKEARVEVRLDNRRETNSGVAADLIISVGGVAVKYNVYLRETSISLQFRSTDRSRAELAALLLRLAGVNAEVSKAGDRDEWHVGASTDKLAVGREELRKALAELVREAATGDKAERWLKKLEKGLTLMEGWPKFNVMLDSHGALLVRFISTNPGRIEQVVQLLEKMGLKRGDYFSVKMPKDGEWGYVRILKEGLAYAAWLSVHGEDEDQRRLAARFVEHILRRAEDACRDRKEECPVYKKAKEIVEEGKMRDSLELKKFEKEFEVNGKKYKVKVIDGDAEIEESRRGKTLLRIKIKVEVSYVEGGHIVRVEREYTITYSKFGKRNETMGYTHARGDTSEDREADAERLAAVIEALTGVKPRIHRKSDGRIEIKCGRTHLEGFMRYKELAPTIKKWLEETSRQ